MIFEKSSRILVISEKILENSRDVRKFSRILEDFSKITRVFEKSSRILEDFSKITRILEDFSKITSILEDLSKIPRILENPPRNVFEPSRTGCVRSGFITQVVFCFLYSNPGKGMPDLSIYWDDRGRNNILR